MKMDQEKCNKPEAIATVTIEDPHVCEGSYGRPCVLLGHDQMLSGV